MAKRITAQNTKLLRQAKIRLVGGVDSPVRSFKHAGGDPVLFKRGRLARVYDYDGNAYIDYVMGWGALILGHAHPSVVRSVKTAAGAGLGFGATNKHEIDLAQLLHDAIPFAEKIRFVNSGTEAVMGALRLARGYTNRDKIVKFKNSYHGHADYLLAKGGSGLATLGIASSKGVPKSFVKDTIIAPYGNIGAIEDIFKRYGTDIAAVIVEPVGGNHGVIPLNTGFLRELRRITKKYGACLVFDEVITGFRFVFGSIAQKIAISPDLICLGKIIGGGLPIGAYGGKAKIMNKLAPAGKVYQASTFSGNPVIMAAGLETLKTLRSSQSSYARTDQLAEFLSLGLAYEARRRGIGLDVAYFGNMFSIRFKREGYFKKFYRHMLENGVYLAPSEFEANFVSFAHTKRDVKKALAAAQAALAAISRKRG